MSMLPVIRGIARGYTNLAHYQHQPSAKRPRLEPVEEPTGGDIEMAKRTFTKLRYRRKNKSKRRAYRRRINRITTTWPRFRLVKFKVVSKFDMGKVDGTLDRVLFEANSLYDPHGSLGANLPLGVDQWAAMYKKYVVVKSTTYVKVHNRSSTGAVVFGLSLRNPEEATGLANAEAYLELPMTRSKMLSPDVDHAALGITYRAKKYWHVSKFMDHDELHASLTTTPGYPANQCWVDFWMQDVTASEEYHLEGHVTTEYTCLLFDRVTPARSTA